MLGKPVVGQSGWATLNLENCGFSTFPEQFQLCPLTRTYAMVVPDSDFIKAVSNEDYKPRHHPGRVDHRVIAIPDSFVKAALSTIEG